MFVFFPNDNREAIAFSRSLFLSLRLFPGHLAQHTEGTSHLPTHHVQPRRRRPVRPEEGLPARARRRRVAPQARDQHRRAAQGQARRVADEEARRRQRRRDGRGIRWGVERPRWCPRRGRRGGRGLPGHWRLRRRRHDGGLDAARRRRKRQGKNGARVEWWEEKRETECASEYLLAPLSFAAETLARRGSVAGDERRDKEGA